MKTPLSTIHRSAIALAAGLSTGAARGEVDIPLPDAFGRLEATLTGEARGLTLLTADRFEEAPDDRLRLAGAAALGLDLAYVLRNGAELRLRLQGEREEDAVEGVRLGRADFGEGGPRRPDQRTLLERAALEISGGYGALALGRTEGAADRAHVGGLNASRTLSLSDDELDLGGLVAIHTQNDVSSFAAKLRYDTPRVLGVRLSASYAPRLRVCGYGFCADEGVRDFAHAIETGIDARRAIGAWRFQGGLSFTQTFARDASDERRDGRIFGAGAAVGRADVDLPLIGSGDLLLGGSWLRSRASAAPEGSAAFGPGPEPEPEPYRAAEIALALRQQDVTASFGVARARAAGTDARTRALQGAVEWRALSFASFGLALQWGSGDLADGGRERLLAFGLDTRWRF